MSGSPEKDILVTIQYTGPFADSGDRAKNKEFLTQKFNEVSEIMARHRTNVYVASASPVYRSAAASLPPAEVAGLRTDLAPHHFAVIEHKYPKNQNL